MKRNLYIIIAQFIILDLCVAQDYHFSQFDANPFYINPALTGERLTDYKGVQFNADYRDQMAKFTKTPGAYRSVAAGIDEPLDSKFSLGQFFYNDKSATGSFNTFGFLLSCAHKIINQNDDGKVNHNLSVGLQLGVMNKSINADKLTYDEQYSNSSADGFDRSIPNGETFTRQSYYNFNANFGIYYRYTSKNKNHSFFGGFAIYNIAKPNESFYSDGLYSALPLRFNLHGGIITKLTKQLNMNAQVLYMNQAKATELDVNALMFYKIEGSVFETIYGLGFRNKNALIFQVGVRAKGNTFRVSYDVMTNSYLKAYQHNGLEFSLITTLKKKNKHADATNTPPPADGGSH